MLVPGLEVLGWASEVEELTRLAIEPVECGLGLLYHFGGLALGVVPPGLGVPDDSGEATWSTFGVELPPDAVELSNEVEDSRPR